MTAADRERPLVAHVLFRFDVGGLENGVVNLINHMPKWKWRHAVVALESVSAEFAARIRSKDVILIALGKPPGHLFPLYPRLTRLFRSLDPAIVHTRNLAALEAVVPAWMAGVKARVHGEHGWDVGDLDGVNQRFKWVRRMYRPFVGQYVALSTQIVGYLTGSVGIPRQRIAHICNGVDTARFFPRDDSSVDRKLIPFGDERHFVIGSVGRLQPVKNHAVLIEAFAGAVKENEEARRRLRLVIVGDGPLRGELQRRIDAAGVSDLVWLSGGRDDVPELMRCFDLFVLPSLSEGISNTILEAMATGLPVIAGDVGGNSDLVEHGVTGSLLRPDDATGLQREILAYFGGHGKAREHGRTARQRVEERFSIEAMVSAYDRLYEAQLQQRCAPRARAAEGGS